MITFGPSRVHGRGVFAAEDIPQWRIIERCPVIIFSPADRALIDRTRLYDYYFEWEGGCGALPLGLSQLYNHSYEPNAVCFPDLKHELMVYQALRDIMKGEEILVNYNRNPDDKAPVWFER